MTIINGTTGNDFLTGTAENDLMPGNAGDNTLIGGLGDDILVGGLGNNTLTGADGADTFVLNDTGSINVCLSKLDRLQTSQLRLVILSNFIIKCNFGLKVMPTADGGS